MTHRENSLQDELLSMIIAALNSMCMQHVTCLMLFLCTVLSLKSCSPPLWAVLRFVLCLRSNLCITAADGHVAGQGEGKAGGEPCKGH